MFALLLLLTTVAYAFDVLKTDDLLGRIEETSARAGGPVVVAAAGAASEQTLRRLLRLHPEAPCTLERVPLMGDAAEDMGRLLGRSQEKCGLRVSPGGVEGEWLVSEHGACGATREKPEVGWIAPVEPEGAAPPSGEAPPSGVAPPPVPAAFPARESTQLLLLEKSLPDPTTALLSSFLVGFGTGHFYAKDARGGWLYAGLQAGGLAVYGLSRVAGSQAFTEEGETAAQVFGALGLGLSFGARLVDAGTAPGAAHVTSRRMIERQAP